MTRNVINLDTPKGPFSVCVGWDRPLQEHFCNICYQGDESLLTDDDLAFYEVPLYPSMRLDEIKTFLASKELKIPDVLFQKATEDADMNYGNVIREFNAAGALVVEHIFN